MFPIRQSSIRTLFGFLHLGSVGLFKNDLHFLPLLLLAPLLLLLPVRIQVKHFCSCAFVLLRKAVFALFSHSSLRFSRVVLCCG